MKVLYTLGADLSKQSIDLATYPNDHHLRIENSSTGFKRLKAWIRELKMTEAQVMVVMEHTGFYSFHFEAFLHKSAICFTKVSALQIKRSMGLVRGKTDKLDAGRIARYGWEKRESLKPTQKMDDTLQRLQLLRGARSRLVKHRASLKSALTELTCIVKRGDELFKTHLRLIDSLSKEILQLDHQIEALVKQTTSLHHNYQLLTSVGGVGPQIAVASLVKTQNFTIFANSKKFACYAGTAPFEHSSGTSIRKKTRVSHLADKEMKTLLDLGATSAIQHDPELKAYYQRRVAEGKSKKSTINIVRNKIIHRMFAVIKRQTPYTKQYSRPLQTFFG